MDETEKLKALMAEYLLTLQDDEADEHYATNRGLAQGELEAFLEWLQK